MSVGRRLNSGSDTSELPIILGMAAVSAQTSYKLTVLSLFGSIAVLVNHAFSLRADYQAVAGQDWAFFDYFTQTFIKYGFGRIATPFFFCLSGFLLVSDMPFMRTWWPKLRKRVRTLAVPFLFWAAWSFLVILALQAIPFLQPYFGKHMLLDSTPRELAELMLWNPIAHPLWFVRDLFILVAVSPLLYLCVRNQWIGVFALGAACGYWFAHYETRYAHSLFYFPLGMYLAIHRPQIRIGAVVEGVVVAAWLALLTCSTWAIMRDGQIHPLYYPLAILFGVPAVWLLYDHVAERMRTPTVAWLASLSFFIYVTHVPIVEIVGKGIIRTFGLDQSQLGLFAAFMLTAAATLAICVIFGHLVRTFLPGIYALATGERGLAPIASGNQTAAHPALPALGTRAPSAAGG